MLVSSTPWKIGSITTPPTSSPARSPRRCTTSTGRARRRSAQPRPPEDVDAPPDDNNEAAAGDSNTARSPPLAPQPANEPTPAAPIPTPTGRATTHHIHGGPTTKAAAAVPRASENDVTRSSFRRPQSPGPPARSEDRRVGSADNPSSPPSPNADPRDQRRRGSDPHRPRPGADGPERYLTVRLPAQERCSRQSRRARAPCSADQLLVYTMVIRRAERRGKNAPCSPADSSSGALVGQLP